MFGCLPVMGVSRVAITGHMRASEITGDVLDRDFRDVKVALI
jgi:hypothetical protein